MTAPASNLTAIRNKVRRITGRSSANSIDNPQLDTYINTFYIYDLPELLHLISLRYNYQFVTNANQPVYDFPSNFYLTNMPPVFIAGYQSYMTQSRENFFRINPGLQFLQQSAATGNGTNGPYSFTCTQTPITKGFKRNPPGAYSSSDVIGNDVPASYINWNVLISGTNANGKSVSLIDDGGGTDSTGLGLLFDPTDTSTASTEARGTIDYATGAVTINSKGFTDVIPAGNPINCQYVPYVASRPQSVVFYQDQFILYPIPDQAYTVSFEAYKRPDPLDDTLNPTPQLQEWWQLIAWGAAMKIFEDNGDVDSIAKFRPLFEEQLKLVQRRTIVQQTSERSSTIYTEQSQFPQYPFGNLFSGF